MFLLVFLCQMVFSQELASHKLLGHSVTGRPIYADIVGHGEEVILMVAGVHGNEWVGTPLFFALRQHLLQNPALVEGRKVVLIPMLNPDGWVDDMRSNRKRVDLNRNFPSPNYGRGLTGDHPLSEPESRILYDVINTYKPARIIGIHQPFTCVDYDGEESAELAKEMARLSNLPIKKLGVRSGSLGAYVRKKYPLITMEMRFSDHEKPMKKLWKQYGPALLAAVSYSKK